MISDCIYCDHLDEDYGRCWNTESEKFGEYVLRDMECCGYFSPHLLSSKVFMIADHYGLEGQKLKLIEEMAELTQAILKRNDENVIEEMADVKFLLMQLEYLIGCTGKVEGIMRQKADRQIERIRKEEA